MKCPACTNVDLLMGERQGVEIDYCPTCRGVWLDRGELDKIVERSFQQDVQQPTRQPHAQNPDIHGSGHAPAPGYGSSSAYKPHRKKSFLENLID
jgi:Zn-finger nucleic acid-binding protein